MSIVGAGTGAVVRQGHLRKLKTMKKKFFVLRAETPDCSAKLEYYESEKKFKAGASPRRVLTLKSCYNIMRRLDLKQKHVIALFTREEQFCIVAENEQDLHGWLSAILKQHRSDDASEELLHPIQHVWQVNVQKKGLGASKNIHGLYNLCLTDKTLSLVKIKSHNNVISDLGIPERVEYSLKNIRRCGDSECFFYMEVGRQTATGAGELWMLSDDSNIAQSMHSTIYHAMRNCAKESEHERDHIVIPKNTNESTNALPPRRQTMPNGSGLAGLCNDKGLCVSSCIRQCVCHGATRSIDDSAAAIAPLSADDTAPARIRCESMPSRASYLLEVERPPPKYTEKEALEHSRDEADSVTEWHRTPRIPEEPDCCDISKDFVNPSFRTGAGGSIHHSRTSSLGVDDAVAESMLPDGYLPMAPGHDHLGGLISASSGSVCSGTPSTDPRFSEYQLEPATSYIGMESRPPRSYSVGSRPATRAPPPVQEPRHRAYSVGTRNRPAPLSHNMHSQRSSAQDHMELDFSNNSPAAKMSLGRTPPTTSVNERLKANVNEYVDMSRNPAAPTPGYLEMRPGEQLLARTPPTSHTLLANPPPPPPDGYVEMNYGRAATRPITIAGARSAPPPVTTSSSPVLPVIAGGGERRRRAREPRTPDGSQTLFPMSLDSPASPASPPDEVDDLEEDPPHHPLTTVRELSEDGRRSPAPLAPVSSSSPQYVTLVRPARTPEPRDELSCNPTANKTIARLTDTDCRGDSSSGATVVLAGGGAPARFSIGEEPPSPPSPSSLGAGGPLNYAALDLEPRRAAAAPPSRTYTQIDFILSEKLHAADGT